MSAFTCCKSAESQAAGPWLWNKCCFSRRHLVGIKRLLWSRVQTFIWFRAAKPTWSTDDRRRLRALMCRVAAVDDVHRPFLNIDHLKAKLCHACRALGVQLGHFWFKRFLYKKLIIWQFNRRFYFYYYYYYSELEDNTVSTRMTPPRRLVITHEWAIYFYVTSPFHVLFQWHRVAPDRLLSVP